MSYFCPMVSHFSNKITLIFTLLTCIIVYKRKSAVDKSWLVPLVNLILGICRGVDFRILSQIQERRAMALDQSEVAVLASLARPRSAEILSMPATRTAVTPGLRTSSSRRQTRVEGVLSRIRLFRSRACHARHTLCSRPKRPKSFPLAYSTIGCRASQTLSPSISRTAQHFALSVQKTFTQQWALFARTQKRLVASRGLLQRS
jgi:hypothetical protein